METVLFDQCYFSVDGNRYRNQGKIVFKKGLVLASRQLIFQLVVTIFFLHFSKTSAIFFPSSGNAFFNKIVHFGQWKRILELIMASTSRKKTVNKRILFPLDKNSDSTSQNVGFLRKIRFHHAENMLSPAGISEKKLQKIVSNSRREWLKNMASL